MKHSHTLLQKKFKYLYSTPFNLWQFSRIFLQTAFSVYLYSHFQNLLLEFMLFAKSFFVFAHELWVNKRWISLFLSAEKNITRLKMFNHGVVRVMTKDMVPKQDIFVLIRLWARLRNLKLTPALFNGNNYHIYQIKTCLYSVQCSISSFPSIFMCVVCLRFLFEGSKELHFQIIFSLVKWSHHNMLDKTYLCVCTLHSSF